MKQFTEKLIGRLEEESDLFSGEPMGSLQKAYYCKGVEKAIEIINQLAEEYNSDFCEWKQFMENKRPSSYFYPSCDDDFLFPECDVENFRYCPYCGKKIKIAPYQPEGE